MFNIPLGLFFLISWFTEFSEEKIGSEVEKKKNKNEKAKTLKKLTLRQLPFSTGWLSPHFQGVKERTGTGNRTFHFPNTMNSEGIPTGGRTFVFDIFMF